MNSFNSGLSDVMKLGKAIKERDYIKALLIITDMSLKASKNQKSLKTFILEEAQPILQFTRQMFAMIHSPKGSKYYGLKLPEKLKILSSSWRKHFNESWRITKLYLKIFVNDVRSGKFQKRIHASLEKIFKMLNSIFYKERNVTKQ